MTKRERCLLAAQTVEKVAQPQNCGAILLAALAAPVNVGHIQEYAPSFTGLPPCLARFSTDCMF